MDPSMSAHFGSPFLPPSPDHASSAGLRSPSPFILSTHVPYDISLSCGTRWPGSQGLSFVQSSPNLTNTMPSTTVQREGQAQIPFQTADLSLSLLANGPAVDYQPRGSLFPSQLSPSLCNDLGTDLKEKQPPRPSNAFILFRSDFLKRKLISKGQEARQHKLSIIAAKCWHKLSREEKKKWFLEAEREKKAHALKYAYYQSQSQPRARAPRTRRESRVMASSRELEHLGRLADMAYQEIISDIPSQLARESTTSLFTSTTTALASDSGPPMPPHQAKGIELFTLDCYQEQERPSYPQQPPFPSPAGEEGQLFLPQSYQLRQTASANDFGTFQDADILPTTGFVGTCPATIARPASAPMCPTASSFSGTAARQLATFPSEALRGSASFDEQTLNYFTMFGGSLPHDTTLPGFSGQANA